MNTPAPGVAGRAPASGMLRVKMTRTLEPEFRSRGARPPRAWLDAPSRPAFLRVMLARTLERFLCARVFREGAENCAPGARAPFSTSVSWINSLKIGVICATFLIGALPAFALDGVAVIVNKSVAADSISMAALKDIYIGRTTYWADGQSVKSSFWTIESRGKTDAAFEGNQRHGCQAVQDVLAAHGVLRSRTTCRRRLAIPPRSWPMSPRPRARSR